MRPAFLALMMFVITLSSGGAVPARFNYQARLTDNAGYPLSGPHTIFFALYRGGTDSGGGTLVYSESAVLDITDGMVNHAVGTGTPLTAEPFSPKLFRSSDDMYLQAAVDAESNPVLPRTRIDSVPFALTSADGNPRTPVSQPASFPIRITQPGSYYLTENIRGTSGRSGIEITTGNVTLDLNGFTVLGVAGSNKGIRVYSFSATPENVTIKNGIIANWTSGGILCDANHCRLSSLHLSGNGLYGISTGQNSLVEHCMLRSCCAGGGVGIACGNGSIVRHCTVTGCTVASNNFTGISCDIACVVAHNLVHGNIVQNGAFDGINIGARTTAKDNKIVNNTASSHATGIRASSNMVITHNQVEDNRSTSSGSGYGIYAGVRCTIANNTCATNAAAGPGVTHGIYCSTGSVVKENHCASHSSGVAGYGIFVQSNGSKVIRNETTGSSTAGIRLDSSGNYCADNLLDEATGVSQSGTNTIGSGDHANIVF